MVIALQFGADVAETAASVAQAAERGGIMPLLLRLVTGRWRARLGAGISSSSSGGPAGFLAPPEGTERREGGAP